MDADRYIDRQFRMVVLQPTTRCSWQCDYCYLTTRDHRREMTLPVAEGVARGIRAQESDGLVSVVWHGGEPLSLRMDRFEPLLAPFEPLRAERRIRHAVQTNAGLITAEWCELVRRYDFKVGVSIDGPAWANVHRRDAAGRPAFERAMRGIETLKEHGLPFTVIAVVTAETIERADDLMDFFENLGAVSVGFNLEEFEGANRRSPSISRDSAERFWEALFRRRARGSTFRVRELDRILDYMRHLRAGETLQVPLYGPIPTVAWNGDTVLLSPELAGIKDPAYGDFVVGNVVHETLPAMVVRADGMRYVREFTQALAACAAGCEFHRYCGGAQAGNRYFEHGSFDVTETAYCVNTQQSLVRALHRISTTG